MNHRYYNSRNESLMERTNIGRDKNAITSARSPDNRQLSSWEMALAFWQCSSQNSKPDYGPRSTNQPAITSYTTPAVARHNLRYWTLKTIDNFIERHATYKLHRSALCQSVSHHFGRRTLVVGFTFQIIILRLQHFFSFLEKYK